MASLPCPDLIDWMVIPNEMSVTIKPGINPLSDMCCHHQTTQPAQIEPKIANKSRRMRIELLQKRIPLFCHG